VRDSKHWRIQAVNKRFVNSNHTCNFHLKHCTVWRIFNEVLLIISVHDYLAGEEITSNCGVLGGDGGSNVRNVGILPHHYTASLYRKDSDWYPHHRENLKSSRITKSSFTLTDLAVGFPVFFRLMLISRWFFSNYSLLCTP
jgi:hypothetical protein